MKKFKRAIMLDNPLGDYTMRNLFIAALLAITTTTAASATSCDREDVYAGIGIGLAGATVIGVSAVAMSPVVGAGAAAGATVGWAGAFSSTFIGTTAQAVGISALVNGPMLALAGTWVSCIVSDVLLIEE
jgi:hypothetical protein